MKEGSESEGHAPAAAGQSPMRWDSAGAKSSYCNIAKAGALRDAVVVNFGLIQSAGYRGAGTGVELLHRVVLSPVVAKNLHDLLSRLIAEHDAHYGKAR